MIKIVNKIKTTLITAWKTKSFGFSFWGVFVFGSVLIGFLGQIYYSILMHFKILQNTISIPGYLNLWGYFSLAYLIFSIIYLYKKINLLPTNYQKYMYLFLGFYICSVIIMFRLTGRFSFFYFAGGIIYDLITGVTIKYYFSSLMEFNINTLKCAAGLSFK